MNGGLPDSDEFVTVRRWAARELEFAVRAGKAAARAESSAHRVPPRLRERWAQIAALYRRNQWRHLVAARMHTAHANRLRSWAEQPGSSPAPAFAAAVAEVSGTGSIVVTLSGRTQRAAVIAASDPVSRAAHDLEVFFGEGPASDAAASREAVGAAGGALSTSWPLYGPAVKALGVHAVAAAPMCIADRCLGTLTALHPRPAHRRDRLLVQGLADALAHTLLLDGDGAGDGDADGDALPLVPLFGHASDQGLIHQAAGMVAGQSGLDIPAALALIQARAFADNLPAGTVAMQVLSQQLHLAPLG